MSYVFNGVTYKSMLQCCQTLNVNYTYMLFLKKKHKITSQEAIEHLVKKLRPKNVSITFRGITYENRYKLCNSYNVSFTTIYSYMKKYDVNFLVAFSLYLEKKERCKIKKNIRSKPNKYTVIYKGKTYKNMSQCCKELNLNYGSVRQTKSLFKFTNEQVLDYFFRSTNKRTKSK